MDFDDLLAPDEGDLVTDTGGAEDKGGEGQGPEGADSDGQGEDGTEAGKEDAADASGSDIAEGDGSDGVEAGEEGKGVDGSLTGIEQYLSQFDIEGGIINFEDGTSKHFTELESDKQAEILGQLHDMSSKAVEEKYGLDPTEIQIINHMRENKLSFDDIVENAVNKRVSAMTAMQQVDNVDYDKLDKDVLYASFLQKSNPEATQEQIEQDLEKAKSMSNYDKVVERIRSTFKSEQEAAVQKLTADQRAEMEANLEKERGMIVEAIAPMEDIDGVVIDDTMKNSVLDIVLSVDEDGDSKFMTEVFSDPTKLVKAAFWYKNGADILKSEKAYWKKEKSEAFRRGQNSVSEGGVTFKASPKPETGSIETTPVDQGLDNSGFDDLHN